MAHLFSSRLVFTVTLFLVFTALFDSAKGSVKVGNPHRVFSGSRAKAIERHLLTHGKPSHLKNSANKMPTPLHENNQGIRPNNFKKRIQPDEASKLFDVPFVITRDVSVTVDNWVTKARLDVEIHFVIFYLSTINNKQSTLPVVPLSLPLYWTRFTDNGTATRSKITVTITITQLTLVAKFRCQKNAVSRIIWPSIQTLL